MFYLMIFLPLVNSILAGCCGNTLGMLGVRSTSALTLIFNQLVCWYLLLSSTVFYADFGTWMSFGSLSIKWSFLVDQTTVIMFFVVNTVSTIVHVYSFYYMGQDPSLPRFISYLSLFTFFMNILVSAGNLIVLFIGWEGVGLCSYLLIGFWYTRFQANKAAMKALVVNRVGDYFFLVGSFLVLITFHTTEWPVFLSLVSSENLFTVNSSTISIIALFLFLGAMAKSAQIGLHTWLPDAMEGPTPVSALIHAATMVTAGVFLLIRCSTLLCFSCPNLLAFITFIGALTALFAATVGLAQNDVKKVIAYSTCSQLGYMVFSCGLLNFSASFFHLFNHAFFKALLFLGAGSVIHTLMGEQDMRRMGGLAKQLPVIAAFMTIASLSLAGFPFLSGFYSKDVILEMAVSRSSSIASFAYFVGVFVAFITAFYSIRLLILVFLGKPRSYRAQLTVLHATTPLEIASLSLLCFLSIFSGYLAQHYFVTPGSTFTSSVITGLFSSEGAVDFEFLPLYLKLTPTFASFLGLFLSFYLYRNSAIFTHLRRQYYLMYVFLITKWGFDLMFNVFFSIVTFQCSLLAADLIEKRLESNALSLVRGFSFWLIYFNRPTASVFTFIQCSVFILLAGFCLLCVSGGAFI